MPKQLKISKHIIQCSPNTDLNEVINNPNCTLFGEKCDQPFTAFYMWEKFFCEFSATIDRFIELGCDNGGMSTYFLLWCINAGIEYKGYDKNRKNRYLNSNVKKLVGLGDCIRSGNLYADKVRDEIIQLIQEGGRTVVFCDCIDKPWEFKTFAPNIKSNDIIAIHDWDRAIKDEWVKETLEDINPYELLYEDERLQLNTLTRFFLKL